MSNFSNYWQARNESLFKARFSLPTFVGHYGYMWINTVIYNSYGALSGSKIMQTNSRLVIFCFAGQTVQAVLRILIANASGEIFNPYRRTTLIAWGLMSINMASLLMNGEALMNEQYMFAFINVIIWSAVAHFVWFVM